MLKLLPQRWSLARLVAVMTVALSAAPARAGDFPIAGPVAGQPWGGQLGQPIAPTNPIPADEIIQPGLQGPEWLQAYMGGMLALPPGLDAARAHRWYSAPPAEVLVRHQLRPIPARPETLQALDDKQRAHAPALLAELDARFETLAALADNASRIVLPPETADITGPVYYCDWIGRAAVPPPVLGRTLYARCIQDRDAYLDRLVHRLADLAVIPALPAPAPMPSYRLSRSIIPADHAPSGFDYPARVQLYRTVIGQRLEGRN